MKVLRALVGISLLVGTAGCPVTEPALTPARKLEGTWSTTSPVTFFYQTDYCGNATENVATALWNVTWVVTAREGYSNVLDIEMHYARGGSSPLNSSCGADANGWVPLVSPTFLEATLSSSEITAYDHSSGINAFGSFTSDNMALTWVHHECIIYCTGEVSGEKKLILVRQH